MMINEQTFYILVAIGGFIALFEPYITARIKKEKYDYKNHIVKIIFGAIALIFGLIRTVVISSNMTEKQPYIELAETGSFFLTNKKDTIEYELNFTNTGDGNATDFKMTITPVAVVNPKHYLIGNTQTIDLNGLSSGKSKPVGSYVFMRGTPDSLYVLFNATYNSRKADFPIVWYPGLKFVRTVSKEQLAYIQNLISIYKNNGAKVASPNGSVRH